MSAAEQVAGFAAAWRIAAAVPGWLTETQGELLWDSAARVTDGLVVEIGSHQGRSTLVLASASGGQPVVAIDPFVAGGMFGGAATQRRFETNIATAGLTERVELVIAKSTEVRPGWTRSVGLLYIDGKHDYWTVTDDLRWAEHVVDGGTVLIHDSFSSIGVTLGLLAHALPSRRLHYRGRVGSLAAFSMSPVTARSRLRMLAQLPWFARNVLVKILLRLGRLVGFNRPDPY
ncbi:MAG: class I SAM-dependent methyltransferase [Jatrophihabitans sp.]